jgi:ubiquinone/menaquinone biosynthesis C-methylase UbiE
MYEELAKFYDLMYSFKEYKKEVKKLRKLITQSKESDGKELLDVACGTGNHLNFFKKYFNCTGIDINDEMLKIAKEKVPNVKFEKANMINFNLGKEFDIITCLFSSIGYVKTLSNLEQTLRNFSNHLRTGGIVIIEPWFTRETYNVGTAHMATYENDEVKIARLNVSEIDDDVSIMDMHYLIATVAGIQYYKDHHELGLFSVDLTLNIMTNAGLNAKFLKNGLMRERGLYLGKKVK